MAAKPVSVSPSQAASISPDLRNNIYSALLASNGIRNIEATMERQLAESGFKDELKRYVTDILRSGQATTFEEARSLVLDKVFAQMRGDDDTVNGVNGITNGTNGTHTDEPQKYQLKIDDKIIKEGTRVVRKELEKVCEITEGDES